MWDCELSNFVSSSRARWILKGRNYIFYYPLVANKLSKCQSVAWFLNWGGNGIPEFLAQYVRRPRVPHLLTPSSLPNSVLTILEVEYITNLRFQLTLCAAKQDSRALNSIDFTFVAASTHLRSCYLIHQENLLSKSDYQMQYNYLKTSVQILTSWNSLYGWPSCALHNSSGKSAQGSTPTSISSLKPHGALLTWVWLERTYHGVL